MYQVSLEESYFPLQSSTPLREITIGDMLAERARLTPDKDALKEITLKGEIGRIWTYDALYKDSVRLAKALASRHAKGARVAVYAPNIPEWVLLEFACGLAGVTLVTVNPAYQARELEFVLKQSRAEALYLVEEFRGNPMAAIAEEACKGAPGVKTRFYLTDHQALFDGEDTGVLPSVVPSDIAQIQYTSGTTGFPKGALLHHFGLVQNAKDSAARAGCLDDEIVLHNMPMFHTTGCGLILLGFMAHSATILLAPLYDPAMLTRIIVEQGVTRLFGVPTMIVGFIEAAGQIGVDTSSLRGIGSGGAMVAPELARKAKEVLGADVVIVYGQTESSPVITSAWPTDTVEDRTETIGQPMPHTEVAIRDPGTGGVCAIGVQGEICCRGYHVMTGYNDNPEATASAIKGDGWLHTGDLGVMDARGYVKITGRVKEMIIRGGENLFPVEIENALLEHDAIAEAAVVGKPDEKWGEEVACFMRANAEAPSDARPTPAELKAFIRDRLSPQKTPRYWIWVDEWPLTGSGKIQKFKLVEGFERNEYDILQA